MDWFTAFSRMTRNGIGSLDLELESSTRPTPQTTEVMGTVPIVGHGGLSADDLASAGASIETRPALVTVDDIIDQRQRLEAFVERAVDDVHERAHGGTYWDQQSAEIDPDEEREALASEMDRLGRVEGAAVVGWVVRNAALRTHLPIARLARLADEISDDALDLADTLLGSAQRLDPTDGGFVFSLRPPKRRSRWRSRGRFGHLWVYGD